MSNAVIKPVEQVLKEYHQKLKSIGEQLTALYNEQTIYEEKIRDLERLQVQTSLKEYGLYEGACVVCFAHRLDYHVELITVYKILEIDDNKEWGPSYKGIRCSYHLVDNEYYCKSEAFNYSAATLLYNLTKNDVFVSNKEKVADDLIIKLVENRPTINTYTEYMTYFTDHTTMIPSKSEDTYAS